jgi:hypothetical protein
MPGYMKKMKYSNGGIVARKEFKNVGEIEGRAAGNQNFMQGSVTASKNFGGTRATASIYKDNKGGSSRSYSLEKQLPGKASVGVKVRKEPTVTYHKNLGKGFNLNIEANRKGGVMRISKPL